MNKKHQFDSGSLTAMTQYKIPPHSLETEMSVVGALMLDNGKTAVALENGLRVDDFYMESLRTIYEVICEQFKNNKPAGIIEVGERLKQSGKLAQVGGYEFISKVQDYVPSAAYVGSYINILKELAARRRAQNILLKIYQLLETSDKPIDQIFTEARNLFIENTEYEDDDYVRCVLDSLLMNMERIEAIKAGRLKYTMLKSGLLDLDKIVKGFPLGKTIIIAARPSVGKTALAQKIMANLWFNIKVGSVTFSLETDEMGCSNRLIAQIGEIYLSHIQDPHFLNDQDFAAMNQIARQLNDSRDNLIFDYSTKQTTINIWSKLKSVTSMNPNIKAFFIDYLQLIKPNKVKKYYSRENEVSNISKELHDVAKNLNMTGFVLCQLNRQPENRNTNEPKLSDLRESGSLEQDADMVIFLWRENPQDDEGKRLIIINATVAKNRDGPTGRCELLFDRYCTNFKNKLDEKDFLF